ncbi:hypothetical protein GALMADRAFT_560837 [Galerina marginata CBS 339.88]|uniref:Uncharacterized protein n=1 Tax=Galerina marginata (strain CBS 339.88) TaxID=685588 RepID=A0A067SUZ2_GALM3|nr:hypothetical protein GALMADRAFT_560837 [Galerina marginata CBS 339.88]
MVLSADCPSRDRREVKKTSDLGIKVRLNQPVRPRRVEWRQRTGLKHKHNAAILRLLPRLVGIECRKSSHRSMSRAQNRVPAEDTRRSWTVVLTPHVWLQSTNVRIIPKDARQINWRDARVFYRQRCPVYISRKTRADGVETETKGLVQGNERNYDQGKRGDLRGYMSITSFIAAT